MFSVSSQYYHTHYLGKCNITGCTHSKERGVAQYVDNLSHRKLEGKIRIA